MIDIKILTDEKLVYHLVELNKIIEELKSQLDEAKIEFESRNIKDILYVPKFESKVYLAEGRNTSEYDVMKIYVGMVQENIQEEFPKIVKINQSQVNDIKELDKKNLINSILLKNVVVTPGKSSVTIRKMTKQELKEHLEDN